MSFARFVTIHRAVAFLLILGISSGLGRCELAAQDAEFRLVPAAVEPELLVADDLQCDLLLREPIVANPLQVSFDERGRMWVVQYRQYPWPAGLKLLSRDNVWRNVYSPPFAPPPPHPPDSPFAGQDRISIHEDADGDGELDTHAIFLDGLNFATAIAFGRGGVYVLNPPYLLFYPDRDRDDRADTGGPEILLSGFGIEDSHSIASSLTWGPDGWLYGAQGSTVSAAILIHGPDGQVLNADRPIHSMGQLIWRYHPERRSYEVFAEGGGNTFGVEIDAYGRVFSGHNGGDTRGFYYVQGGYSQKNFGKHGELSNPYAFAYYAPMRHPPVVRFTHTFCITDATGLPPRYRQRLWGVNPVEHSIVLSDLRPDGSSQQTEDVADIVKAGDGERARWFTPVDIKQGPDGAIYVADWYSVQPNHYRNHEGQTNPDLGRVYRFRGRQQAQATVPDLAAVDSRRLIDDYLLHETRWYRQTALRLLADRRDATALAWAKDRLSQETDWRALHLFWAVYLSGGWTDDVALLGLQHPEAHVRRWAIRYLGDDQVWSAPVREALLRSAEQETNREVRLQLAATAKRLPAETALPLVMTLTLRADDVDDPLVPNMLWWAIESHCDQPDMVVRMYERTDRWDSPYRVGGYRLVENVMRRFALAGTQQDLITCARLMRRAPSREWREALALVFAKAFQGRRLPALPGELSTELAKVGGPFARILAVRRGESHAIEQALVSIADRDHELSERLEMIGALGDIQAVPEQAVPLLLSLLHPDELVEVQVNALRSLQKFPDPQVGARVIDAYESLPLEAREAARQLLAARVDWTKSLLAALDRGQLVAREFDEDLIRRMRLHRDGMLQGELLRHFPERTSDAEQRAAQIVAMETLLHAGGGNPLAGRELFHGKATCAKCHRLFHRGADVGPDLTSYNRTDAARMLLAILHPDAEIREGFARYTAITADGRVLAGLKVSENERLLVLRGADGLDQEVARDDVEELNAETRSMMPAGLLDILSDQEIRDLFAYLMSTTPPL